MTDHAAGLRRTFAAVGTVLLLAGCAASSPSTVPSSSMPSPSPAAVPAAATSDSPVATASPVASAVEVASAGALPDVARVTCGLDPMTNVLTPSAAPRTDGLHLQVTNPTGAQFLIEVRDIGGENAPPGTSETVWPVPPGAMRIRCSDTSAPESGDAGWVTLEVVDTDAVFGSTALDCPTDERSQQDVDYAGFDEGGHGDVGDPVEMTRSAVAATYPADLVESAGYPDARIRMARVSRDGRPIAVARWMHYPSDAWTPADGWLFEGATGCAGIDLPGLHPME